MGKFKTAEEAAAAGVFVSKIKSYVKREGRLTGAQQRAIDTLWPAYGLQFHTGETDATGLFDFERVFGNTNAVVLEIGFGMGTSLAEMAKNSPDINFIGIEVHRPGIGNLLSLVAEQQLTNVRVMEHDAVEVLQHKVPDSSLERLQLFFPDPWHKKRHHKRRIVQPGFIELVCRKLRDHGQLHMATDWENYAEHMAEVANPYPALENTATTGHFVERPAYRPITKFEQRGARLGHGVWDLIYRKVPDAKPAK